MFFNNPRIPIYIHRQNDSIIPLQFLLFYTYCISNENSKNSELVVFAAQRFVYLGIKITIYLLKRTPTIISHNVCKKDSKLMSACQLFGWANVAE